VTPTPRGPLQVALAQVHGMAVVAHLLLGQDRNAATLPQPIVRAIICEVSLLQGLGGAQSSGDVCWCCGSPHAHASCTRTHTWASCCAVQAHASVATVAGLVAEQAEARLSGVGEPEESPEGGPLQGGAICWALGAPRPAAAAAFAAALG
jgi:hypothetical protein